MKGIVDYINEQRQLGQGWKIWKEDGCDINMLAFKEPSQYGIDGGRISKLWIRKNGKVLCNYDRGWDVNPDKSVKDLYDKIIRTYN